MVYIFVGIMQHKKAPRFEWHVSIIKLVLVSDSIAKIEKLCFSKYQNCQLTEIKSKRTIENIWGNVIVFRLLWTERSKDWLMELSEVYSGEFPWICSILRPDAFSPILRFNFHLSFMAAAPACCSVSPWLLCRQLAASETSSSYSQSLVYWGIMWHVRYS